MKDYFCGWYFKCQSDRRTLAVIPSVHISGGKKSCSVQLISDDEAWNARFPFEDFSEAKDGFNICVNGNRFGESGMSLDLNAPGCRAKGCVRFGKLSPIRYDIMGPFRFLPFMECRHSVLSMEHTVTGNVRINGTDYRFDDGVGYIEGDRGRSFPKEYAWAQCNFGDGSVMLSVADIPVGLLRFTGVIAVVMWRGKEYRLATYLGGRAVKIKNGEIVIRQGGAVLTARLLERRERALLAPENGAMSRTIRESASCRASFRFRHGTHTLFSFDTSRASFEYEYPY